MAGGETGLGRDIGQGERGTRGRRRKGGGREKEREKEERDAPRVNSLLAGSARSAMPNPGGTAYTPFPAHPLDEHAALSLLPLRSLIPLPSPSHIATPCLFLSFVSHSLLCCTKLQFIAFSLASIRPSLHPPLSSVSHSGFLTPAEVAETPTSYATLEYPPYISLPLTESTLAVVLLRSSLILSLSLSLSRSHVPRRRTIGAPKCGDRRRKFASRNFGSARSVPSAGRRNSPVCAALPCRQVVRSE